MLIVAGIVLSVIAIGGLGWSLWRQMAADRMQSFNDERRSSCRLVGKGELVEGRQHIPVSMALSWSTLYYENADLEASLDLHYIEEVEYADELSTGARVGTGKVIRLRCYSTVFEFVVDAPSAAQWQTVLPPVRLASS
jgi:hypothetical protein